MKKTPSPDPLSRGEKRDKMLGNEPLGSLLAKMSVPAMIGMFVNALYNLVDTIYIGRGVGAMAIGGLTIILPFQMLMFAFALMIGVGSASIVSRALGAGDQEKANQTAGNAFLLAAASGLFLTIVGYLFMDPILRLFGATEALFPYAKEYLEVILLGVPFIIISVSANNLIRSEGRATIAMVTMLIGAVSNIIMDPIFIFVLDMGIAGAAWATVIGRLLSCLFVLGYFLTGKSTLDLKLKDFIPDFPLMYRQFALGFPNFVRQFGASFLAVIVNNSLKAYGGDLYIAAFGAINRLLLFYMMPLFGVVQGFQPIAGFNYGAKNYLRVKGIMKLTGGVALIIAGFFALLTFLFPRTILSVFTTNPELLNIGVSAVRIVLIFLPAVGLQILGATFFMAIGKALPSLLLSMSRQIILLIPLVLILPRFFGVTGVWAAFPAADGIATLLTLVLVALEFKVLNRQEEEQNRIEE